MIPCVVKSWMLNLIFDIRWPYFLKFWLIVFNLESWDAKYDDFVTWWPLNTKYDIWLFFSSMTLECEIWYMMSSSFDDPWMRVICLDDPWMWIMIYDDDDFVLWWPLNVNYDIQWFVLWWPLNTKHYIWWYFASMILDCKIWYWVYMTLNSMNYKDDIVPR
jgi:hypothetical protein